jgi:hypothetical protein
MKKLNLDRREEHKLRVCENKVLTIIFGPKREREDIVTGTWRKVHNKKLHHSYSSTNIIRRINQGGWDGRNKGRREICPKF